MRRYTFSIGRAETGQRLDRCLTGRLPDSVSRAMIQRGIREGLVTVGGRVVKTHYRLRQGDRIEAAFAQLPAPSRARPLVAQPIPLDIVYEDDALLVVNKPAGLVTHPAPGHWDGTLVNAILWHLRPSHVPRAGIIHRLDKDTSGLLLVAKTPEAHLTLSRQMKARLIHRRYLAVVDGWLPLDAGTVNAPIGRHLTHRKQMTIRHLGGRAAVTHYHVLQRVRAAGDRPAYAVIEVGLETGRTHQIRVHVAHLGHPVLGDSTYGRRPASCWRAIGVRRHLLHAYRLSFQHPVTGRPMALAAPIPEDIMSWIGAEVSTRVAARG